MATTQLPNISNELAALVNRISPSVVAVHGRRGTPSSGVQWRTGLIVTAEHTLRRDEDIGLTVSTGETIPAELVGRDPGTDIALLKSEQLTGPAAEFSDNDKQPRVGDLSLVVGRSPNSGPNASLGIISAVSGPWRTWRGGQLDAYLRLGAEIFSGSSGGAVVDYQGRLIGIATSALSRVAGLAIPASTINRTVDLLLAEGSIPRPYLGVGLQSVPIPESFQQKLGLANPSGLMVLSVDAGASADTAGILVGDILLQIDGTDIEDVDDLQTHLGLEKIGKQVKAKLIRGGEARELSVTVGKRPGKNG